MAYFASDDDETLMKAILDWIDETRSWMVDIEGWRYADVGRRRERSQKPDTNMFFTRTSYLCGRLRLANPPIDATALEEVYEAISLWDRTDGEHGLLPQAVLEAKLDRALLGLHSLADQITSRMRRTAGPAAGTAAGPKLSRAAARVLGYVRDKEALPTYDDITTELQMGRGTVSRALKELRAKGHLLADGRTETEPR